MTDTIPQNQLDAAKEHHKDLATSFKELPLPSTPSF
jgi:hypothetical protein